MEQNKFKDICVSICIPIYGVEDYIERCARSVFEQTYNNIEYVFVNDCTKDDSMNILSSVLDDYPHRKESVKIISHEKNRGLAAARNTALEHVSGDFVFWVDSDDFIRHDAISLCVKKQQEDNSDIVILDVLKLHDGYKEHVRQTNSQNPEVLVRKVLLDEVEHWIWGKLIRTSLYIDNHIRVKEGCNMGEDLQIYPQLLYHAKRISYVPIPAYVYDMQNQTSYGHTIKESIQWQRWGSYDELCKQLPKEKFPKELEYQKLQMVYFQLKTFYLFPDTLSQKYYNFLISKLGDISRSTIESYVFYKRFLITWCLHVGKISNKKELPIFRAKIYVVFINLMNSLVSKIKALKK